MAAAQTPGTPAPETAAEPVESGDPLADALAAYTPPEGETEAEAKPAAKPEEKKPEEAEKKPDDAPPDPKKKRQEFEAYLLSDGVLGTKEGIEKAAKHFRSRQSKIDGMEVRVSEKAAEVAEQREMIRQAYEQANAELETDRRRAQAIRKIDETLTSGTIEEMLETLGRIRGKSGREVWDAMARVAIAQGKAAPVAAPAEIQRLEAKIEQLVSYIREREEHATEAATTGETEQLSAAVKEREDAVIAIASDAAKHPELARYVRLGLRENIVTEVVKMKTAAKRAGRQLDNAGALAQIEAQLKELPGGTSVSPAGAKPGSPAAAIADDHPITGIAPSQTRSAGSAREKTEAELAEDLARDLPGLSGLLGIDLSI